MAQYRLYRPRASGTWQDVGQLRQEMDSVLDRFASGSSPSGSSRGVFPAVNLYETGDAYVLTAELPGVEPADIHVSLEGSTVTLQGERKIDYSSEEGASLHRRERQGGDFRRAFELPAVIDADKVEATHRNGVLMLRLPKSPEAQPRQITVQTS